MAPEMIVDKPSELPDTLARLLEKEGRRALAARGFFSVALPGGSVATTFFPRLSRAAVDWSRTHFFWGDERAVAPSDPESNFGAARSRWLEPAGVKASQIHRMEADAADPEAAARAYADTMTRILGAPPRLDLVLLGVGPDGHVCSLFPGHPLLLEESRSVALVLDSPKPPPRRLTLTLPVLAAAELVVVAALGSGKAEIVRESIEDPSSALPLARVVRRARRCVFFVDPEAASRLASLIRA
jgi:6-phosphogluconolactonase